MLYCMVHVIISQCISDYKRLLVRASLMRSIVDCIKTKQQIDRYKKSLNVAIKTADGAALRPVEVNYNVLSYVIRI